MILKLDNTIIADEAIQDGSKFLGWYPEGLADGGIKLSVIIDSEFEELNGVVHSIILNREDIHKLKELGLI